MTTYPCGCVNVIDPDWLVERSVSKCDFHSAFRDQIARHDMAHYEEMGAIINGVPQHKRYIEEFLEPLNAAGGIIPDGRGCIALEIGCGLGMYAPLFLQKNYLYTGIEPEEVPAYWTESAFNVPVHRVCFEALPYNDETYSAIMAAHIFEHLESAPTMISKAYCMLKHGGHLYIIVPDDMDPVNPDHLWFFNQDSLGGVLHKIGFTDIKMTMRRRIERENFIYCSAMKV